MPPEDQRPAQIAAEHPHVAVALEEPVGPLLAERRDQVLLAVTPVPGVDKGVTVGVRRVDLD